MRIRFDQGIELFIGGRWRSSTAATILVLIAVLSGVAWLAFRTEGPLQLLGLAIILVPNLALVAALFWYGGKELVQYLKRRFRA
jgi:hypothetical protein